MVVFVPRIISRSKEDQLHIIAIMTSETSRRPKAYYKDHNGFLDAVKLQATGQPSTAKEADNGTTDRDKRDAVQKRLFAQHVLDTKGSFFPRYVRWIQPRSGHHSSTLLSV